MVFKWLLERPGSSGPKGRGFESRHFDIRGNPGSIRLPGFFSASGIRAKLGKTWGKLGEKSGRHRRKRKQGNSFRLGELGEICTSDAEKPPRRWRLGAAAETLKK